MGTILKMREHARDLIHEGAPSPAAAQLPTQIRLAPGVALIITTGEEQSEITPFGAIILSAGATRVMGAAESVFPEEIPEPADLMKLGEVLLVRATLNGGIRLGREQFQLIPCRAPEIHAAVKRNGIWEELRPETILGLLGLGVSEFITEAIVAQLAEDLPDTPEGLT